MEFPVLPFSSRCRKEKIPACDIKFRFNFFDCLDNFEMEYTETAGAITYQTLEYQ